MRSSIKFSKLSRAKCTKPNTRTNSSPSKAVDEISHSHRGSLWSLQKIISACYTLWIRIMLSGTIDHLLPVPHGAYHSERRASLIIQHTDARLHAAIFRPFFVKVISFIVLSSYIYAENLMPSRIGYTSPTVNQEGKHAVRNDQFY